MRRIINDLTMMSLFCPNIDCVNVLRPEIFKYSQHINIIIVICVVKVVVSVLNLITFFKT